MRVKSLRNQNIILVISIVAITLISTIIISQVAFLSSLKTQTYKLLDSHNKYVKFILDQSPIPQFSTLDTYSATHEIRITLLDREGTVVYDSDYDEHDLENHLFREEVQISIKDGIGMSERKSDTQEMLVLYLSRFDESSVYPIIRTSTPLYQLKSYRTLFNELLLGSVLIIVLIIFTLTIASIRKITRPLEEVNALANQYSKGNLKVKMSISGPSEISELAFSLTSMASKLKKTIDELNASQSMIETMINSVAQGLLLLDENLTVRIANTASYQLLPATKKLEGQAISKIVNSNKVIESIRQCKENNTHTEITIEQYSHLYGETAKIVGKEKIRTLRFAIDPINDESSSMALVITITDMSEIVKLEQIRRDFVANVSHELKTPITAIAGFSQTLLEEESGQLQPTQLKFLSIIHRQGQNMLSIVQDLLLLSSLEQEHTHLTFSWIDIDHVIEQSILSCKFRAKEKEIEIHSTINNEKDLPVFIHPILIGQALTNLLTNAIVYSPPKSHVNVETVVNESELVIKVIDSGYGIPAEEQERIFERFYRVDAARSRSSGGTGLGLSIVKHIAHVHHGNVTVTSSVNIGSTFTITIDRKGGEFNQLEKSRERIME